MKMSREILTRLLRGEHFNVDQRQILGLWPPETLYYTQVVDHLSLLLETQEWFPRAPIPSEAIYVHRIHDNEYVCSIWPGQAGKAAEKTFKTAREAAEFYLKWELHLPGSLDGWPVADDRP